MTEQELEQLTAYLDGELPPADARALEARLAAEPRLREAEAKLRRAVCSLKEMPHPLPSAQLRRDVLNRLDEAPGLMETLATWFTFRRLASAGVLGIIAATAVWATGRRARENPGFEDPEQVYVAQNMEVLEDFDVLGLEQLDDLEVVEQLHQLEAQP
jgi:anti-sigma factor RsiW